MKYLINISGDIPHAGITNINIPLNGRNLIITGKNSSGKTSFLTKLHATLNTNLDSLSDKRQEYITNIGHWKQEIIRLGESNPESQSYKSLVKDYENKLNQLQSGFDIQTLSFEKLKDNYKKYKAIFRKFDAMREIHIEESMQTTSSNSEIERAQQSFRQNIGNRLEQHLVNVKTSEAFAKGIENDDAKGKKFENWFNEFEVSLRKLFENEETKLIFRNEDRKFQIYNGKNYTNFQTLSSGYKAIFDIFADLLLRTEFFDITPSELEGIVLIDEIDAHLHISLQRLILPFFTESFPNIQFIVSTHSPFVITSTDNDTVVYDISSGEFFEEDLSHYSHESIIKELFHVQDGNENLKALSEQLVHFIEVETPSHDLEVIQNLLNEINKNFDKLSVELQLQYMVAKNKLNKLKHEGK